MSKKNINYAFLLLLLSLLFGCVKIQQTNSFSWKRTLKQSKTAEAVQLYFKEGLVDSEMERAAEQMLAEVIPIPVVLNQETTDDQKVLKIIINGTQRNYFDEKSYGRILAQTIGYNILYDLAISSSISLSGFLFTSDSFVRLMFVVGGMVFASYSVTFSFLGVSIFATAEYQQHKLFKEKYGYLPLCFNAFGTFSNESNVFDDKTKIKRAVIPKRRYKLINMLSARRSISQEDGQEIVKASLEAWIQKLAQDLNEYKIGSKAKSRK